MRVMSEAAICSFYANLIGVGRKVFVLPGTMALLKSHGYIADYMTESIDEKRGVVVHDHTDVVGFPHWGVDLGFEYPVGIPERCLIVVDSM